MTLLPGEIISTGTPSGVGPIQPGDQVTIHVEGVGALTNPVTSRED
jgi:2-keto-4-pentenoate hydratase/2-oxohepta-3-ene-1,7-dioic acid hydratase in catechol pathway